MPGDMERFVQTVLQKTIHTGYSHLKLPAIMAATVVSSAPAEDGWFEYALQIVDADGAPDPSYPMIPEVRAPLSVEVGRTVAVGMLYGMLTPVILTEVRL